MEEYQDYQERWARCRQMLKERIKDSWVYDTWFSVLELDAYDEKKKSVVLAVPSRYVSEFLDHFGYKLLFAVLSENFGEGFSLCYRIQRNEVPSFEQVEAYLRQYGLNTNMPSIQFSYVDARKRLEDALSSHVGKDYQWLPGYDRLVRWLNDNKGKGLLLIGTPGLGKTLICQKILPSIFGRTDIPYVSAHQLPKQIDELLKKRVVIIDDLGKEDEKYFGQKDNSFFRLVDAAEKNGNLLIIATNLSTTPMKDKRYPTSIEERYGSEVLDRLRVTTFPVLLKGEDMRSKE